MILPKDIKSRHAIRDSQILNLYTEGLMNTYLIASKFHISQPRVIQIVKQNAQLVLNEKDWNKIQRLNLIKQDLRKPEFESQVLTKKDVIELWRKEFEKDVELNTITQFFSVEPNTKVKSRLDEITK